MMAHLEAMGSAAPSNVDCGVDPVASLVEMFVSMVQSGRIAKGQCPALRPVFLKPHGVARGVFRVRPDLPADLKTGLFGGTEYPAWVRFSSDTLPTIGDFKTTLGIGIKLFHAPAPKVFGPPQDTTFDFILQNFDVFFVDTAADMCAFTKAGVVDGDYGPYLAAHPETAKLLDEMAKPVASTLATAYWSCVPFAFGSGRFVKYKLEPTIDVAPIVDPPTDPTYLAADLEARLKAGDVRFRFLVQFSTDPVSMPLDKATVRWEESVSAPVHVADLVLHQQDVTARGQPEYGENLAWNIWRVTKEHEPQGSIALARRAVYAAAAQQRRDVNGIPTGEPAEPKPALEPAPCADTVIVRAAIHPAIGIARIGDSENEFFVGPEVVDPAPAPPDFYRDAAGALKRQAARFRIFGYNAAGEVVRELTADNAAIRWTAHLANKKAQWYQFQAALDIPDAATMSVPRRNPTIAFADRGQLAIDPGPRSISGRSISGSKDHVFDTGTFKGTVVPLGEIRTDEAGRLLVLGGTGKSASPSGAPVYNPADPNSFNNANDWYDDISDGPVTATVSINGQAVAVEPAWVAVAPPNYAPNIIGWRTLHELLVDVYVECGWMSMPQDVSFAKDVLPVLRRLSDLQWVNKGFAAMFGKGGPMDFASDAFIAKLAQTPDPATKSDPFAELRQVIFNSFRPSHPKVNQPPTWPRLWPWIYGDAFGSFAADSPDNNLALPSVQEALLRRWVKGDFVNDWPASPPPTSLDKVPLAERPAMLDKASLHFCLADAFHPGCEVTWPMRHATLYHKPFRIRHRERPEPDYGKTLDQQGALQPDGPLYAQGPGDLTRWMALPWQGDTAFCRSGYDLAYDPYVPTFWTARVPNQVLTEEDYQTVVNTGLPRATRVAAFNHRPGWLRAIIQPPVPAPDVMMRMIAHFGALGVVQARPGIKNDPDFPEVIFVESLGASRLRQAAMRISGFLAAPPRPLTRFEAAGWANEEQYEEFRNIRVRHR
jgi:L-Lysine epsilon oxidase N-terminal/L-lysine epsilon oxidase C-terminal domain